MHSDPSVNVVVFQVLTDTGTRELVGQGPTRAADGVRQAWARVREQHDARAEDVRQVYSEWEPSPEDKAFLDATFPPNVEVSFSFRRPPDDDWEQAMKDAEAQVREAAEAEEVTPGGELLPVLRTYDHADVFSEAIVSRPIGANLAVFLAHVAGTPQQTLAIEYLMRARLGDRTADEAFRQACDQFVAGLTIEGGEASGEKVFVVRHRLDLGTSALALPDFYDNARGWTGTRELFVAFTDPGTLYVMADAEGPYAQRLRRAVQVSTYWGAVALTPACYALDEGGLRLLVQRTVIA